MSDWIPVTERLPDDYDEMYLVTAVFMGHVYVTDDCLEPDGTWFGESFQGFLFGEGYKVLAWMPKPDDNSPKWISYDSEILPEPHERYLALMPRYGSVVEKGKYILKDRRKKVFEFIAWMPLPEPYQANEESLDEQ